MFNRCPETGMPICAPLAVRPEMIDYNGHMNVAFYVKLFDEGLDLFFADIGLAESYVKERHGGFFAAEVHVRYLRELHLADLVQVRMRILDLDEKRVHYWMELVHATERFLSATMEGLTLHMDMAARRVAPFPPDVLASFRAWKDLTTDMPMPEHMGRTIGIPRKG